MQAEEEEAEGRFSLLRLQRVVRELAEAATSPEEHAKFAALDSVLTGGTDMHSQAAHVYLLICPELLEGLRTRDDCNAEYITLSVLGLAWTAWDMKGLTALERTRRIELLEALLIYNLGGDQLYLPFYSEGRNTKGCGDNYKLNGILSQHLGVFSMQNFLALLQNNAVRRQSQQQFPLETFIERAAPNNEIETFFSQIAVHGYKPRLMELQARIYKVDAATRILHDPTRRFYVKLSRKKKYDPVEFLLASAVLAWNDGSAIDMQSPRFQAYLAQVQQRAIAASRGQMNTIRNMNTKKNNTTRDALRQVAGAGTM